METTGLNLLIPDKPDPERSALADVFSRGGGKVHRVGRFWEPPVFDKKSVKVYGPDAFCLVLQQKLGFELCSPADDLLLRMPARCLQREVTQHSLADALTLTYPAFVKPIVPKQFRSAVYASADSLKAECKGLGPEVLIMVSEVVTFTAEVRCFVLDGQVLDAAVYEGTADVTDAVETVQGMTQIVRLPRAVVVDAGYVANRGWGIVEFNAAWGAGLNGCDAERVLPAILAASSPSG